MSSHSPRRRTVISSRSSGHYHCESLEQRVLLSRLGDFVTPMPLAAPSDPLVAHQAGRINTTSYPEYRDLSLLAQSTTAA